MNARVELDFARAVAHPRRPEKIETAAAGTELAGTYRPVVVTEL